MKYNRLTSSPLKCFKLPELNGGTDFNTVRENCLKESLNMWHQSNRLKTRPGVNASGNHFVKIIKQDYYDQFDFRLHDATVNYLDTEYRIGTVGVFSGDYNYTLYVYLIASEINIISAGTLNFLRISSEIFKVPENITFYVGKPQNGGGIFALVSLVNTENNADKNYNIYEINADFSEWERVYDYYIPTLLINGRGNDYELAAFESNLMYPAPRALESQNLLNGRFNAYYTSDGYSSSFRLPVSNLTFDTVVCRIYYTTGLFVEWKVSGPAIVDTQLFMGADIMLTVDHELGIISFTNNGQPFPIPIMTAYSENNIKVTAVKEPKDGLSQVVDSSCSLSADGRIYISGGKNGNILMSARSENPLYFPQAASADIGGAEPVTALSLQGKKIIAFKDHETYFVTLRKGKRINEIGLIADNDTLFKASDTLSPELISKTFGCRYKNTVCNVRDKIVWLSQNYEVCLLEDLGFDSVARLSENFTKYTDFEFMDSFAVSDGRYYILFDENKAFACDLENFSVPKWYDWRFGKGFSLCGGFYKKGDFHLWCNADNSGLFYLATLNGEYDVEMYINEDRVVQVEKNNINSFIRTKDYVLSGQNHKNIIETVCLALSGKGKIEVKINDRNMPPVDLRFSTDDYDKGEYKSVSLIPHLYDTKQVSLNIASDSEFSLGEIEIFYRKTG